MSKIVHFEIPADDTERARAFHRQVFDWKIDTWEGPMEYHLVTAGPEDEAGINGAIMPRGDNRSVVNNIEIDDVDEYVRRIEDAGGKIIPPKMAVPGIGWMAFSLIQRATRPASCSRTNQPPEHVRRPFLDGRPAYC